MIVAGYILAVVGCVAFFLGELRMLVLAYRRGIGWLLATLLLAPLFWLALLAVDFKTTAKPFALAFLGAIALAVGGTMARIEF